MELMNIGGERYINVREIVAVQLSWRGTAVSMSNGQRFRVEETPRDFALLLLRHKQAPEVDPHRDIA